MAKLFGTDGIRGVAGQYPMTLEMVFRIGQAVGLHFKQEGHKPRIVIGRDTRLSGLTIETALVDGICSTGAEAVLTGVLTTPGIAYLTRSIPAPAGIIISASHNPFPDNGIKIFSSDGYKLDDKQELKIEKLILSPGLPHLHPSAQEPGRVSSLDDAGERYIAFLKNAFPPEYTLEGIKVILDCAHGATYQVAPKTFFELGAEVITLFNEPDGKNINENCGSQHPERLAEEVIKRKTNAGFAFDGDGDRLIAIDENGTILTGDQILTICARQMKEEGILANNLVVSTVMSNIGLERALKKLGIERAMTKVGDRYVLQKMQDRGAVLGGEESGHLIFLNHQTTGDGIVSALKLLGIMKKTNKPLSELAQVMTVFPQLLINVEVKSKPDLNMVSEIEEVIKEVEEKLGDNGRVLVRYSGTQPLCRVMVEGPTREETERLCQKVADVVRRNLA